MSFQFDTLHISHQLTTGIGYPECFGLGEKIIRGSVYLDGPTITGDENTFKTVEGSVMIGPCNNEDSPLPKVCDGTSFYPTWSISPCENFITGNDKNDLLYDPYTLVVRSGQHLTRDVTTVCSPDGAGPGPTTITPSKSAALFIGDVDIKGVVRIDETLSVQGKSDFKDNIAIEKSVYIGSDIYIGGDLCLDGTAEFDDLEANTAVFVDLNADTGVFGTLDGDPVGRLLARIQIADSLPVKPFDIVHPSLGEGNRLRYACIEGPEAGVYFRGRVKNSNEIKFPPYWKDLVHVESITVQLQPIGSHQDIIVKRWDSEKVYLQSRGGMPIDCFYHVYAERKDVNSLIVEYKGEKRDDYPDKYYDDPQFSNTINTKTL